MTQIEFKTIEILDALYLLSKEDKVKLTWVISKLSQPDQQKFLIAVYNRYMSFQKGTQELVKGLQKVVNNLLEVKEKKEAEKVLAEL